MKWLCLLLLSAPLWGYQSRDAYKSFFQEGQDLFEQGDYQGALAKFQEAFRQEPKAQRYRKEGAFFANYLPRYWIARAYAKFDVLAAEEWVAKSQEALESEILKRKDDLADYHENLRQITAAVETQKSEIAANYDRVLREAKDLLDRNRFDEARGKYESLMTIDGDRPEAAAGLASIATARDNYLKGLVLEAKTALLDKDFDGADVYADQIAAVDAQYSDLISLRRDITNARKAFELAQQEAAKPKPEEQPTQVVRREEPAQPPPRKITKPSAAERAQRQAKIELRRDLLETIKSYRRGFPSEALEKWEAIQSTAASGSASYHWLEAVYVLTVHVKDADTSMLDRARAAVAKTVNLAPSFTPDPNVYPDHVVAFFEDNR